MHMDDSGFNGPFKGRGAFLRNFALTHPVTTQPKRMARHPHAQEEPEPARGTTIYNSCNGYPLDDEDFVNMTSGPEFQF